MSEIEEGRVERVVAGGAGLIRREGPVAFVRGVLPGERIRYRLAGKRRGVLTGELLEVLELSPNRVAPPCEYYQECGGCEIQEIDYPAQLTIKTEILKEQLRRIGGLDDTVVEEARGGASYGYRTRLRMHRARVGGFGFRRRQSREIVTVERCIVASEALNREIAALQNTPPRAKELTLTEHDTGVARSDTPKAVTATLLGRPVRFSGAGFFQSNLTMFSSLLEELLSAARPPSNYLLYDLYAGTGAIAAVVAASLAGGEGETRLGGSGSPGPRASGGHEDGGARLGGSGSPGPGGVGPEGRGSPGPDRVRPDGSASPGPADARPDGRASPGPAEKRPEGDGYAAPVARPATAAAIHCVEPVAASARFIPENLADFAHTVHQEPLEQFVAKEAPAGDRSIIVVDPPRGGLSEAVREWLRRSHPAQLFYVSCDPATLARDLGELSSRYRIEKIVPFDFFPQTSHIESLSLLTPKEARR